MINQHPLTLTPVLLLSLFVLLLGNSCGIVPKNTNLNELAKVIEMSKGPCYGTCPIFTITVYDNGVVAYKGERFTTKNGLSIKILKKAEYESLLKAFKDTDLWKYKDVYRSQIPDLQTVTMTYYEEGDIKSIVGRDGRPEAVLRLEKLLDEIADVGEWKLIEKASYGLPPNVVPNELIIQLVDNVEPETWVRKYARQKMTVVKSLPNDHYWIVKYNADIMPPREMLGFVRRDDFVLSAEFNKKRR